MKSVTWSIALNRADPLALAEAACAAEGADCAELHIDVMDGGFVPNFGLSSEVIAAITKTSKLPCDVHLAVERPERHVKRFAEAGCAGITVHVESPGHVHRTLQSIRDLGVSPGIAINPASPLTRLEYVVQLVDRVLVLTQEPGSRSEQTSGAAFERVKILRENLDYHERRVNIQVEGVHSATDAARLIEHGADIVVLDNPALHRSEDSLSALRAFIGEAEAARNVA